MENDCLWYYPVDFGGALDPPTQLGTCGSNWQNMTLVAPGYAVPQHALRLWARDNTTGTLWSYLFANDGGTWTLSTSGTAATIAPENNSSATKITGVPVLTQAAYPAIASAGDGNQLPALYVADAQGSIWVLAANTDQANLAEPLSSSLSGVVQSTVPISQLS